MQAAPSSVYLYLTAVKKELLRYVLRGSLILFLAVALIIAIIITAWFTDFLFRAVWNYVIPEVFGLPELKSFQGLAIILLVSFLKGNIKDGFLAVKSELDYMVHDGFDEIDKLLKIPKQTKITVKSNYN